MSLVLRALVHGSMIVAALAAVGCSGSDAAVGNGSSGGGSSGSSGGGGGSRGGSGGGGSDSPGDALFQPPASTSATPDSILGLWGGALEHSSFTFDMRIKLEDAQASFATRCQSADGTTGGTAFVRAKARVSNDDITVLESKQDEKNVGGVTCRASTTPSETKRCAAADKGFERRCFTLEGTTLTLYGDSTFDKLAMTKISD